MNCPLELSNPDCKVCLFSKENLCDYPFGITPAGELFEFKPKVTSVQLYGEYTMGIIDELEVEPCG